MKTQLYNKASRKEVGSTHPPTDAQAAALAKPCAESGFGHFVPTKPVENKIKFIIEHGLDVLNISEADARSNDMSILYAFRSTLQNPPKRSSNGAGRGASPTLWVQSWVARALA